jgi:lipopolysaccharide transport LptD-like protein
LCQVPNTFICINQPYDIDSLEKENGITLALENKIQTKRSGDSVDLVRFIASTDFLFNMKKNDVDLEQDGKFTEIDLDLEINPYNWLYLDCQTSILAKNQSIKTGSVELNLTPNEVFKMAAGYRYEKLPLEPRNQLTFDAQYIFSPKWRFGVYERINMQDGIIEEQQFSVTRDLHCWEMEVTYDLKGNNFFEDDYTIWVAFRIKAFPDLPLGLSRSFSKRPPGSLRD